MTARRRRNPFLRLLGVLSWIVVLSGAGYGAYWIVVRTQAEQLLTRYIDDLRADGYRVTFADTRYSGTPQRIDVTFDTPSVGSPDWMQDWSWTAETLRVSALPLDIGRVELAPTGLQSLSLPGSDMLDIRAVDTLASVAAGVDGLSDASVRTGRTEARSTASGALQAQFASAQAALTRAADDLDVTMQVADLVTIATPADAPITLDLDARVRGGALFTENGVVSEPLLAMWAQADGGVDIARARIAWPDADAEIGGGLAPNEYGLWNGSLTLEVRRPDRVITHLSGLGLLDGETAQTAAALATAATNADGVLKAGFRVRDGGVFMLGLKVGDLPRAF